MATGHDEHVHVVHCGEERQQHVRSFHNGDVASSVRWQQGTPQVFSCTTDAGDCISRALVLRVKLLDIRKFELLRCSGVVDILQLEDFDA